MPPGVAPLHDAIVAEDPVTLGDELIHRTFGLRQSAEPGFFPPGIRSVSVFDDVENSISASGESLGPEEERKPRTGTGAYGRHAVIV
jgi:hypothetical protein